MSVPPSRRLLERRPSCAFSWWKTNSNAPDRSSSVSGASARTFERRADRRADRPGARRRLYAGEAGVVSGVSDSFPAGPEAEPSRPRPPASGLRWAALRRGGAGPGLARGAARRTRRQPRRRRARRSHDARLPARLHARSDREVGAFGRFVLRSNSRGFAARRRRGCPIERAGLKPRRRVGGRYPARLAKPDRDC